MQGNGVRKSGTYDGKSDSHRSCPPPLHWEPCVARPNQPNQPRQTMTENKTHTSMGRVDIAAAMDLVEHSTLRFHMDFSAWDVIEKEIMDWRDSTWTSMALPGNKMCMSFHFMTDDKWQDGADCTSCYQILRYSHPYGDQKIHPKWKA